MPTGLSGVSWVSRQAAMKLDHYYYEDDFTGDLLRDEWSVSNSAGGGEVDFAVHATGEANGTITASTTADTGDWVRIQLGRVLYKTDLSAVLETRLKINDVSECEATVGFLKDADEYAYFFIDAGDINGKSDDAAGQGPYSADALVNATDNTYVTLTVELLATETAKFYVDGILKLTGTTGAVTADPMDAYFDFKAKTDTDIIPTIDYVRIWQKRV